MLTGMSAMTAELVTFPVDLVKTRLQLQGEALSSRHGAQPRLGAFGMLRSIAAHEGISGLYQGVQHTSAQSYMNNLLDTVIRKTCCYTRTVTNGGESNNVQPSQSVSHGHSSQPSC